VNLAGSFGVAYSSAEETPSNFSTSWMVDRLGRQLGVQIVALMGLLLFCSTRALRNMVGMTSGFLPSVYSQHEGIVCPRRWIMRDSVWTACPHSEDACRRTWVHLAAGRSPSGNFSANDQDWNSSDANRSGSAFLIPRFMPTSEYSFATSSRTVPRTPPAS